MKFEYDGDSEQRECVAYLHSNGGLFFNVEGAYSLCGLEQGAVVMGGEYNTPSNVRTNGTGDLDVVIRGDRGQGKKFYPGDKVTITF